ncbi:hypothetical protein PVAP13_5NG398186 [Panicum virgatum]|uniref:BED-type domain-containing protein n=1 Tax=Panicum virgatum TaxID=38727 RepID=A0A8T0RRK1_PANVG|nr:hypothetical protein PVAP13_5NG398186 [Panicum virgatum]
MAGDDDEDDLREDCDALFGPGADDPINVDDDGPAVPACGGAPPPDGNSAKRSRPSTSPVWDDFEKLFKTTADGKTVRYGARCLHCSKIYSGFSSGGTGHLSRHIASCVKRREKLACLSLKSLLILMVVCVLGTTVLWLLVLNWLD